MKDFMELVRRRQSCRRYDTERQPEREKLDNCIEAARLSPSACNKQPWHYTLILGEKAREFAPLVQGGGMNKFASQCPAFAVVTERSISLEGALSKVIKDQDFPSLDIGLSVGQFCLEATEQGLSTCMLGWFREKGVQNFIGTNNRVRLVICVGYAHKDDKLRDKLRKETESMTDVIE